MMLPRNTPSLRICLPIVHPLLRYQIAMDYRCGERAGRHANRNCLPEAPLKLLDVEFRQIGRGEHALVLTQTPAVLLVNFPHGFEREVFVFTNRLTSVIDTHPASPQPEHLDRDTGVSISIREGMPSAPSINA